MREGKKSEGGGAFKAPPPDRIGLNGAIWCVWSIFSYILFKIFIFCTIIMINCGHVDLLAMIH